ncbi:MAG: acyltransferase [Thermococci archaeon]|nr:acyltransferase [Thermococci archaeon]
MVGVAFVQMEPELLDPETNYCKAERLTREAVEKGASLVVLPELFDTGYVFNDAGELEAVAQPIPSGRTTEFLEWLAEDTGSFIVAGTAERADGGFYNSAVVVGPEGYVGKYRKTHLFNREKLFFKPGDTGFRVFDLGFARVGVMICFDWFFPESARTLALMGADVIAHPANLVMPYAPRAMPVRALENRVYTVTADRVGEERGVVFTGMSQIAAPTSEVLVQAGRTGETVGVAEVDVSLSRNKKLNERNDVFMDRRREFYLL